jgi:hypothetical protein
MSNKTPFLSKKVSPKFIKTLLLIFLLLVTLITSGILLFKVKEELETYLFPYFDKKYGLHTNTYLYECEEEEDTLIEPTLIGTYEYVPDEYIWEWPVNREGYRTLERHIDRPESYLPEYIVKTERSWYLKNSYSLDVKCEDIDLRNVKLGDTFKCSVSYNGKLLSSNVRYDVFCFAQGLQSCSERIGIVVYSNRYNQSNTEYLVVGTYEGSEHNKIEVYRLEKGEALFLPFKYEYNEEHFSDKSYMISGFKFEMYSLEKYGMFDLLVEGDMELVTFFQEPTMGVNNNIWGIYSIWSVENDGLYLKKSVMELIEEWGRSYSL